MISACRNTKAPRLRMGAHPRDSNQGCRLHTRVRRSYNEAPQTLSNLRTQAIQVTHPTAQAWSPASGPD